MSAPNPYAAPTHEEATSDAISAPALDAGYVSQRRWVQLVGALFSVQIGLDLALACTTFALNAVVSIELWDVNRGLLGASRLFFILALLPFFVFLVRANRNARAIGHFVPRFSPASMVWWFFVPIFGLLRPVQAVRSVWFSSQSEASDDDGADIVRLWWWLCVAHLIVGQTVLVSSGVTLPGSRNLPLVVASLFEVTVFVVATRLVHALHHRQELRAAEFGREDDEVPSIRTTRSAVGGISLKRRKTREKCAASANPTQNAISVGVSVVSSSNLRPASTRARRIVSENVVPSPASVRWSARDD